MNMRNAGFTVLETIVAISVVTVGAIGVFGLVTQSISLNRTSANQAVAVYLAQEGIELVRNIRDTNFLTLADPDDWDTNLTVCPGPDGCELDYDDIVPLAFANQKLLIDGGFYNYDTGNETPFVRRIITNQPHPNMLQVQVRVTWIEQGKEINVEASTELYNWE